MYREGDIGNNNRAINCLSRSKTGNDIWYMSMYHSVVVGDKFFFRESENSAVFHSTSTFHKKSYYISKITFFQVRTMSSAAERENVRQKASR